MTDGPPRPASHPAGYDEEDPYEGEDLSTYPDWWRRAVEEFDAHGMRPYRPPRFADDELVPPLVAALEERFGVDVDIRAVDPREGDDWELYVDGTAVATLARRRESGGFTRYGLDAAAFEALVAEAVEA